MSTTVELLREASALMRERATAATPGPWTCYGDHLLWPSEKGPAANDPILAFGEAHDDCREHVTSWHPAVALAVADVLDNAAEDAELRGDDGALPFDYSVHVSITKAHAVALAYLGRDA